MMFVLIVVLSLVSCFVGFALEVAEGNIRHLRNGRPPNAGAAILPNIPFVPMIYVAVTWALNLARDGGGFLVVGSYAVISICVTLNAYKQASRELKALQSGAGNPAA
ncbi:hypothetical protein OOT46_08920 [Aquabacterium sp. A7-Y]|uniref:hypothetical protein n=1 Tax=Aquabacterium sp. A7-Y TaxID=1349605 RepID=UPI00223E27A1|nr:hypothetical protein [Aquabacterium sp. A7-Y]MCW7537971.1 hypothetical protein [Aquabacterium sp. A7-Y]